MKKKKQKIEDYHTEDGLHIRVGVCPAVLTNQRKKWWACDVRENSVSEVSCNYVWGESKEEVCRKKGLHNGDQLPLFG